MNKTIMQNIMAEMVTRANWRGIQKLAELKAAGPKFSVHNTGLMDQPTEANCVGHMLDVCGMAWLEIDGRSPFIKYAKEMGLDGGDWFVYKSCYGGYRLCIRSWNMRQELSVNIAEMQGAQEVLEKYNIKSVVNSRID